jgi:hypothetical protein
VAGGVGDLNGTGKAAQSGLSWRVPGPVSAISIWPTRPPLAMSMMLMRFEPSTASQPSELLEPIAERNEADAAEPAGIDDLFHRLVGVVEFGAEHFSDRHDRNTGAPTVSQELGIHDRAVVVHHIGGALVGGEDDVGGIAEEHAVEPPRTDQGAADDRIGCAVVLGPQRRLEVDGINARIAPPRHQNVGFGKRRLGGHQCQRDCPAPQHLEPPFPRRRGQQHGVDIACVSQLSSRAPFPKYIGPWVHIEAAVLAGEPFNGTPVRNRGP